MLSDYEARRLRDGMHSVKRATTHDWRFYFSYLLGRHVSLQETEEFLVTEHQQTKGRHG